MKQCLLQNGKKKICYELDNHQIIRSSAKLFFFFFFQFKSNRRHCTKFAKIRAFFDTYLPVYRQNRIRIAPYMDRIYDIRENSDTIVFICGKIRTGRTPYFVIFHLVRAVTISVMFILI